MGLANAGLSWFINRLHGGGLPYNTTNTWVGIGNGTTAFTSTQIDLVGPTTFWKNPSSVTISGNVITVKVTFTGSEANFAWQEWGTAYRVGGATNSLMNRVKKDNGVKASGQVWEMTITLTLNAT